MTKTACSAVKMADISDDVIGGDDAKELKTSVKSYPHVAPRVDADSYQAEVPELQLGRVRTRGGMIISVYSCDINYLLLIRLLCGSHSLWFPHCIFP